MSGGGDFTTDLMAWFDPSRRKLPWKESADPYRVWLSEIILQQTRVEQGLPYFERFIARFPTVTELAEASEDEVMKQWEGLGYYSRARNLMATARIIALERQGVFPDSYAAIRALPGVGDYTAAAIASFSFNLPYAVVDGNVYRVLSRYFGIATPIDTGAGKKEFAALAQSLLPPRQAATYNQAIMDFGSMVCKPKAPLCGVCPFVETCIARKENRIAELPAKAKKLERRTRYFNYIVFKYEDKYLIKRRESKDIWQNLWEFALIETKDWVDLVKTFPAEAMKAGWLVKGEMLAWGRLSGAYRQALTHREIVARFAEVFIEQPQRLEAQGFVLVTAAEMKHYAFPRVINRYLADDSLLLF